MTTSAAEAMEGVQHVCAVICADLGHATLLDLIGDDVWTGLYVYLTDQNHGYQDPDTPIGRQFPVNRPVSIGGFLARRVSPSRS